MAVALWWQVEGQGPRRPVVLLPEASRPAAAWPAGLVGALHAAGHPVARLDLRDQGRSPWVEGPYSLADLAEDVAAVLAVLSARSGPVHVVGWGLGGAVAMEVARARPTAVAALTLVGTSGWVADPRLVGPDEPTAAALVWRTRGGTCPDALARALGREHRALCGGADRPDVAAALAEATRWARFGFNPRDRQRAAWLAAPERWSAAAELRPVPVVVVHGTDDPLVPVVVVHGTDDPLVPVAHGRRLAEAAAAPLVEVAGAGHELTDLMATAVAGVIAAGPPS